MGNRPTKFPAIPETPDEAVPALKEAMEVGLRRRGDPLDGFVRFRDLRDAGGFAIQFEGGAVRMRPGQGSPGLGQPGGDVPDIIPAPDFGQDDPSRPPAPTGVRARGLSLNAIGVTWVPAQYGNHAYAEIFASFTDDWQEIEGSFNPGRPIEPGNQSQFFMGTAGGTTWIHRNLGSTVPNADLERAISDIGIGTDQFTVYLDGDQEEFVSPGDTVYMTADEAWNGNGLQGQADSVSYDDQNVRTEVVVTGPTEFEADFPAGATLVIIPEETDLEEALNPRTIYYWVRFVSTAGVVGPVQEGGGVPGTVMVNPEEILNILTGRIRSSQLANDLATPINFIRGPITEVDEDGNRLFPTVRDFVESLGDEAIQEYDETLEQVFLGFDGGDPPTVNIDVFIVYPGDVGIFIVDDTLEGAGVGDELTVSASPGTALADLDGKSVSVVATGIVNGNRQYECQTVDGSSWPLDDGEPHEIDGAVLSFYPDGEDQPPGIAAAAAFVRSVAGGVSATGSWIESLETLQAAIQDDGGNLLDLEGIHQIIGTIQEKSLVELGLDDAALAVWNNLQLELEGPDGEPQTYIANEVAQQVLVNEGSISNSITFKVQQNEGGVLFSAGFGIGLESEPGEEPESTFAVSADQFAIMSAASHGRIIDSIQSFGGKWIVDVRHLADTGLEDGLEEDALVALTVPFDSPISGFRGKTFRVFNRPSSLPSPGEGVTFAITIEHVPQNDDDDPPDFSGSASFDGETHAIFPQQSVPFVVDTTTDPPVIGIRGSLIVNGMITADEAEITGLLRANEVWAQNMTAFGLINTSSLIGETIATPRFGGWAMKMTSPDFTYENRVLEFSKWGSDDDALPDSDNPDDWLDQESTYPQLYNEEEPIDTSFWLDAQGRAFLRGALTVGGNARIWTGEPGAGSAPWFVQMDQEFPLAVFPKDQITLPGMDTPLHESWDYDGNPSIISHVREHALFWVHKSGLAGFNTSYDSLFMGDTPMEPPAGGGGVRVITRQDDGAPTGKGRVWIAADFRQVANRYRPDSMVGWDVALFLANASTDYGGMSQTWIPTQRNSVQMPDGAMMQSVSPEMGQFLDTHFLIIRAPTSDAGNELDPGWNSYLQWRQAMDDDGKLLIPVTRYYNHSDPNQRYVHGDVEVEASGNYRALIVVVERYHRNGTPVWGPIGQGSANEVCVGITQAKIISQQISTRGFDSTLQANTGTDGSGGGSGGGGSGPPPDPGPGPGVDIEIE